MNVKRNLMLCFCFFTAFGTKAQTKVEGDYKEPYRPQVHFSPQAHWMNDPNGMVYYNGTYHLFFQYYPDGTTWGPMHWGHAESKDMVHWRQLPIALYPDSLGYIFSGSAVVDSNNTSGFGKNGKVPMVAIFTHHDPKGEKADKSDFQNESLAYSLDQGKTWTKYAGNPVLKNPGIRDFRDPKVMWYPQQKKWVMTLATKDHITFYSAPNLKNWTKESEFGLNEGAHGGVWECPDLFPLKLGEETYWVLIVNLNPGGPNGGSATQYFIGNFDGKSFSPINTKTKWVDYGPDEYAGITWNNTGKRKIFLGWMSNWEYAGQVPTDKWRNAMTVPRELALKQINGEIFLTSNPVKELSTIAIKPLKPDAGILQGKQTTFTGLSIFQFKADELQDYSIVLSNTLGNELTIGYDKKTNRYYIDRTKSGKVAFNAHFPAISYSPRLSTDTYSNLELVIDASSVELFADDGLNVMTSIFFPEKPFDHLLFNKNGNKIENLMLMPMKSIWR